MMIAGRCVCKTHNTSRCLSNSQLYAPQTKILEGWTKEEIRMFEELFKGVSTRFWLRTIEKYIENLDFLFCSSFRNLRLGGVNFTHPKRRKAEQTFQNAFPGARGSTFQGWEYRIWATKSWKVLRKRVLKCVFGLPKSSFGEHTIVRSANRVLTSLKSASKSRIASFVPSSTIFVWGA